MKNGLAHRLALAVAVLVLIVIVLGASLTSEIRQLPGSDSSGAIASMPGLEQIHRISGYAIVALTLVIAILASSVAGWIALALAVLDSLLAGLPVMHALLAPVFFSALISVWLLTSSGWSTPSQRVVSSWAPFRNLAMAVPVIIFLQIGLGAAFRHNAMGVIWHILNALIVLGVFLVAGIFTVRQYPDHTELRPAALTLLIIAGIQVLLGFSVYLVLLMSSENNPALIVTGVLHVANGALTLAAGTVFAMQVQRNIGVTSRSVTST